MLRRVTAWLAVALLPLAGCGDAPRSAPASGSPSTTVSPALTSPAPRHAEGGRADDIDGDGRADLVVEVGDRRGDRRHLVAVHGSSRGLGRGERTVIPPDTFLSWQIDSGIRADLDGDGFGDVLGYGRPGDRDERMRPYVMWGDPRGLGAGRPPTPVPLPAESDVATYRAVAGDFDGDGAADVAMSSPPGSGRTDTNLAVLYGPFGRDGSPSRRSVQPSPTGGEFWRMSVDRIDGRRATGLIVYEGDDGEQTAGWLLSAGPGGLAKTGRRLNPGMSAAFGDFDGDGTRDVAVGDDGSRNNEPGYETEEPSVDRTLTLYYGDGRTEAFKGTAGRAVAGDFDGDGRDDLAFGGSASAPARPVRLFWGGAGGLRAGGAVGGVGLAVPLTSGDYDGDGDDELALTAGEDGLEVVVTDGRKVLTRFGLSP
ncbi:FG-GAP repeat domain-containing protein [Nonomuraea sp. KM90]|uniref:FG-GAP repeat domain-containing protein n=1 Tax=Nonomuraea sp. KM90 TaxID=3457428 RepID=UPI003FCD4788